MAGGPFVRRHFAVAVAVAGLMGLAGCGGGGPSGGAATSLRMTIWSANDAHLTLLNGIADAYRTAHPTIKKITFDPLPSDTYLTTLTTQIAGGNAPDLAWISETAIDDFVAAKALAPLDQVLRRTDGYGFDDLLPAATRLWRSGDRLYAYPFSTSPFGIFVNDHLFRAAGQPTPAELIATGRWNWQTAVAEASAIAARTGKAGLVVRDFDYKNWDYLSTVWIGWGARAWSDDGHTCGFTDQSMVDAMSFLHRAVFVDHALPGPGSAADFFAGNAAMTVTQISRASLLPANGFAWDLVPMPAGPAGGYSVIGQGAMGVLAKGKHPAAATEFLAYLTNPESSAKLAAYFPPPRRSMLTAEILGKANPLLKPAQLQAVVIDGITSGVVRPSHTDSAELSQSVRAALDPLWKPGADAPKVLAGVCSAIAPLLAKR
jgi:multiple sugar transport system substrate-binding protein